jgi:hypothetical protein
MSVPLQSRFFVVELGAYTYGQFFEISEQLLLCHRIDGSIVSVIAKAVWSKSKDIRDCVKIETIAKTMTDVEFIVDKFLGPKTKQAERL